MRAKLKKRIAPALLLSGAVGCVVPDTVTSYHNVGRRADFRQALGTHQQFPP